jgi:hypothetical protein
MPYTNSVDNEAFDGILSKKDLKSWLEKGVHPDDNMVLDLLPWTLNF